MAHVTVRGVDNRLSTLRRIPVRTFIFAIQLYRIYVSPMRLPTCRFTPTCSQYAVEALTEFGLVRGSWLTTARLAKCGPWHRGGWDPVPERIEVTGSARGRGTAREPHPGAGSTAGKDVNPEAGRTRGCGTGDDVWGKPASRGESESVV